jgi:hypothetical protein
VYVLPAGFQSRVDCPANDSSACAEGSAGVEPQTRRFAHHLRHECACAQPATTVGQRRLEDDEASHVGEQPPASVAR